MYWRGRTTDPNRTLCQLGFISGPTEKKKRLAKKQQPHRPLQVRIGGKPNTPRSELSKTCGNVRWILIMPKPFSDSHQACFACRNVLFPTPPLPASSFDALCFSTRPSFERARRTVQILDKCTLERFSGSEGLHGPCPRLLLQCCCHKCNQARKARRCRRTR